MPEFNSVSPSHRAALALALTLVASATAATPTPRVDAGRIVDVSVYPAFADVRRVVSLAGDAGDYVVLVPGLPARLRKHSLSAVSPTSATVTDAFVLTEVENMDVPLVAEREAAREAHADVQHELETLSQQFRTLDRVESFLAHAAGASLGQGALDATALERSTRFVLAQRAEFGARRAKLNSALRRSSLHIASLEVRADALREEQALTRHRARVRVVKHTDEPVLIELRYRVDGVVWTPSYRIVASDASGPVELHLSANITQASGEDWRNARLRFVSTAPDARADAPSLEALRVGVVKRASDASAHGEPDVLREINRNMEVAASPGQVALAPDPLVPDGTLSVYHRGSAQAVPIRRYTFDAEHYLLAQPVTGSAVYRKARLSNASGQVLPAGHATAYFAGQAVGATALPATAPGGMLDVGLGADARVQVARVLRSRDENYAGTQRVIDLSYRLTLVNAHPRAVAVHVVDQLPVMRADAQASVSDVLSSEPLVEPRDASGRLRWRVEVPADRVAKPAVLDYEYQLRLARGFELARRAPTADR